VTGEPTIALRGVSVHLAGHPALLDVTWSLRPGEHWAFTGANGSGKSTLLRVIRGDQWIDPDGGERRYRFSGTARGAMSAAAHIGFVAPEQQEKYARLLLPIRGRDVVASGIADTLYVHGALAPADEARVDAVIERLRLGAFADRRVRALSFGQLRRLLIARALVRGPAVLVLDEFSNGLDAAARRDVLALLESIADDVQLLFASHRSDDFIGAITHHATLAAGRITSAGPGRPPPARSRPRSTRAAVAVAPRTPIVDIRNADVFRGSTHVLHAVDFSIARGQHTAIVGENGSGKSTFAGLVAGTIAPVFGAGVRRFGRTGPFDVWRVKELIAHVSEEWQVTYNVNHTVEEVVLSGFASSVGLFHVPGDVQRARAAEIIDGLGLAALRERPFMQLSFGERRKVLIARSLTLPPALLILDEVWNGLDAAFRERLETLITDLAEGGTTLLLIAHHAADLPAFIERTLRIDGGTIAPESDLL
jgi:molybdate transport system ATP-binding protein